MKDSRLQEDWRSAGSQIGDPAMLAREFQRERRRLMLALTAELATLLTLLGIAGYALLRSPLISDSLWAAALFVFVLASASAILLARRRIGLPATQIATERFLAAYEVSCRRRLLALRVVTAVLMVGVLALVPFAVRRYRADTFSLTSDHGAFSAVATLLLLLAAGVAVALSYRRAQAELKRISMIRSESSSFS